jgi:TPR repeat protein
MLSYKPVLGFAAVVWLAGCGPPYARPEPAHKDCDGGYADDCKAQCDSNVPRACYRLAWFTERGAAGVKQNGKQSVKLYDRACQAKMAVACRALGELYARGVDGVEKSKKRSRHYYQQACDLGMPEVCPPPEEEGKDRRGSGAKADANADASGGVSVEIGVGGD